MTQQEKSTQLESAETTPTRFVNAGEVRFAYRRFGNPAGTPLVLLQHFRGSSVGSGGPGGIGVHSK